VNSWQHNVNSDEQCCGDVCPFMGSKLVGVMESNGRVVLVRRLWLWVE
jgi:hypothetical protein